MIENVGSLMSTPRKDCSEVKLMQGFGLTIFLILWQNLAGSAG